MVTVTIHDQRLVGDPSRAPRPHRANRSGVVGETPSEVVTNMLEVLGRPCDTRTKVMMAAAINRDRRMNPGPSFEDIDAMLGEWENLTGDASAFIQNYVERWSR